MQAAAPRQKRRAWLIAAGLVTLAAAAGFFLVLALGHRADEQMLRDLPMVESLDQYRAVEDIEFLRMLQSRDFQPQEPKHDG